MPVCRSPGTSTSTIPARTRRRSGRQEHLSDHFTAKTGASLTFDMPEDHLLPLIGRAVNKLGESVVIDLIKKQVGL